MPAAKPGVAALQEATRLAEEAIRLNRAGKIDSAIPLVEKSLAIREKALGPEHPLVATSLNSLAGLYQTKGDYARAEPLNLRSLSIREKALGPQHRLVAASLNNLAELYRAKKVLPLCAIAYLLLSKGSSMLGGPSAGSTARSH